MYKKIEMLPMNLYALPDGKLCGRIELTELAYPLTVQISLNGNVIIPESFDCFGHPIFSQEQAKIYRIKNFEYKKKTKDDEDLKLQVSYKVDTSYASKESFDTLDGISRSLVGLREFNGVIKERSRYIKRHKSGHLNSFVIFGKFLLDDRAQIWSIERNCRKKVITRAQVESLEEFKQNNPEGYTFVRGGAEFVIPRPNSVCSCCGKHLTIYDIRDDYCVYNRGKVYHESCYHELVKCNEILEIIVNIVGCVYGDDEYTYELLPNGYCSRACCAHIPWFLVHTKYGDIVIGKRKRVISIEWQENFKPFDMNQIFASEDVTKWTENGKRGIHAWSIENAGEYLAKVNKSVVNNKGEN